MKPSAISSQSRGIEPAPKNNHEQISYCDSVPENRPWPNRYQVNLRQGQEGNVGALPEARCTGLIKVGQWNQFQLTVQGTRASLFINGELAWGADGLEGPEQGFIALQAEVPGGGQHRFRNIYLTNLD